MIKNMANNDTVWSHSRLNTILENPKEYFLSYKKGIKLKIEKAALTLGTAVHAGLELGTDDLTDYYNQFGSFDQKNAYTEEQLLAESMVGAFLKRKDVIFADILKDNETGNILPLIDEYHELDLTVEIESKKFDFVHKFKGIIDLLLLTEKGFILLDYKTSSRDVDWDTYKSQLIKYLILLKKNFPDVEVYKIGIINLKKTGIRRKKDENNESYRKRIQGEYELDENNLINYHIYNRSEFKEDEIERYTENLCEMMDTAKSIEDNELFFLNYSNIVGLYGKSSYYDIFYKTQDCYILYKIRDKIFDEDTQDFAKERDCVPIDMEVLEKDNIMNNFSLFKEKADEIFKTIPKDKDALFGKIKEDYLTDDGLLEKYWDTMEKLDEIESLPKGEEE